MQRLHNSELFHCQVCGVELGEGDNLDDELCMDHDWQTRQDGDPASLDFSRRSPNRIRSDGYEPEMDDLDYQGDVDHD